MTKRRAIVAGVAVLLLADSGVTAWWLASPRNGTHAAAAVTVDTARVVRTTLTTSTQLSGTLGYSGAYTVNAQLPGTVTALPALGTLISRGRPVFEVDGESVYLFYGARPAWRPFTTGMPAGPDVLELQQNLTALGYGTDLVVDDTFTWATDQAIRAWQTATGQPVTGQIDLGRVAFLPSELRVTAEPATLGSLTQPGQPVLIASSPQPVVTLPVPVTQTFLVHRGDRVTVTVPSGGSTTGRVVAISPVAAASSGDNANQSNGPNGPQQASVPVSVTLDRPSVAANLDQTPVTVSVIDRSVSNVLAVPITSLVALAGGGYAVWVDAPGVTRRLVAVSPGLFADTLVQVTSATLHVGDRVEVPTQ